MPTFNFPDEYVSTDGKFKFPWADLPDATVVAAAVKALNHVFGNEAISKGSTAKTKAGVVGDAYTPAFTEAMYDGIVYDARVGYHKSMVSADWATPSRGPRMPAANREDQIYNMLCAQAVRETVAKSPAFRAVDGVKDRWVKLSDGVEFGIEAALKSFLENPALGAERQATLRTRAQVQHRKELEDAALRKAAKEREAGAAKAEAAEGELVI